MLVVIESESQNPNSAIHRALNPEWAWDLKAQLMAHAADLLATLTWQNGGGDEVDRPDRIERPGVVNEKKERNLLFDNGMNPAANLDPDTIVDARDWLGWEVESFT